MKIYGATIKDKVSIIKRFSLFWLSEFYRAKTIDVSQVLVIHFELFRLVNG